jgi:hypothetical protein
MDSFGPCFLIIKGIFLVSFRLRKREFPSVDYGSKRKKVSSTTFFEQLRNVSGKAIGQKHKGQIDCKRLPCCQETANVNLNICTWVALCSDHVGWFELTCKCPTKNLMQEWFVFHILD